LLGPLLARWTQDLFAPVLFAGCFAAIAVLGGLICLALGFMDPLRPRRQDAATGSGRPLAEIARQPAAVTAFLTALVAYVTMSLLMTATPLAMLACGLGFAESATVIQWHVLGMFAPSFVTGHLIARYGVMRVIAAGVVLMAACVGVDLLGVEVVHFAAGLLLLGVGWNFMFIGATALLTSCYTEAEKAKVQGLNDFLIFTTVAVSASSAGALHHLLGWQAMNLLAVPGLLLVAAVILFRAGLGTLARREALGG
jgi:MFS family permease